jgi:predicted flavoprotein YhiN
VRGEGMITRHGIEGGAVYALSAPLRDAIAADGEAILHVSLRPDLPAAELLRRLEAPRGKQSLATFLRKAAGLSPLAIGLLHEACLGRLAALDAAALASLIHALPLRLSGPVPIDRAISTAGGVRFAEIDDRFMLNRQPGVFVAGEMLDWEAPTGGYLLQACLATGVSAAHGVLRWFEERRFETA